MIWRVKLRINPLQANPNLHRQSTRVTFKLQHHLMFSDLSKFSLLIEIRIAQLIGRILAI